MNGLIGDRFLKCFLKGLHRVSKPGSASEREALKHRASEKLNASNDLEKTDHHEKADELFRKFHQNNERGNS
jgi:hypothetical protein